MKTGFRAFRLHDVAFLANYMMMVMITAGVVKD